MDNQPIQKCRICGCTDDHINDSCFNEEGSPCYWVEFDLCSACYFNLIN